MVNEGELANGFGGRRWDPGRIAPLGAAGAALAGPLVGGPYGVIRVGYENYYRGLGLTPEVVGLGQAAIVSRVGVAVGLLAVLLAAFAAFGVTIFRLARPLVDRSSQPGPWYVQGAWLGAPFLLLVAAVTASGVLMQRLLEPADLKFWIAGSLGAGMIGLQVCWLANVAGSLAGAPERCAGRSPRRNLLRPAPPHQGRRPGHGGCPSARRRVRRCRRTGPPSGL
jgi:hypothetical protein